MRCRYCAQPITRLVSLGNIPLVNSFPTLQQADRVKRYPLDLYFCPSCGLGQTGVTIRPAAIFSEYHYRSAASKPLVNHLSLLAKKMRSYAPASVLDIGCNDGTLLSFIAPTGVRVLGVEPARAIASIARRRGIPVITDFFGERCAGAIKKTYGTFDIVTVTHALANIPDLADFFRGVQAVLAPRGTLILEVASFDDMCKTGAVDSVYHEHYWYFSRTSLRRVLGDAGFFLARIQHVSSQGGSLLVEARSGIAKRIRTVRQTAPIIRADRIRQRLLETMRRYRQKTVVGFGAPAKAVTLINWLTLTHHDIAFVVDATPEKHGKVVPGTTIPVYPEDYLVGKHVDAVMVFSWNYRSEILRKLSRLVPRGTHIIIPFPKHTVVKSS